jgi:hypothetical protein
VVAGTLLAAVLTTGASLMFTAHQQDRAGAGNTGSLAVAEADQARRQALRLATDPKARRLTTAFAGGGRATLFIVGKQATLVITRRDDLPGGQVYQAWVVQPDGRVDAAGITGGPQPWALLLTAVHAGQKISLTAEPPGGSARPTTTPVAVIRL